LKALCALQPPSRHCWMQKPHSGMPTSGALIQMGPYQEAIASKGKGVLKLTLSSSLSKEELSATSPWPPGRWCLPAKLRESQILLRSRCSMVEVINCYSHLQDKTAQVYPRLGGILERGWSRISPDIQTLQGPRQYQKRIRENNPKIPLLNGMEGQQSSQTFKRRQADRIENKDKI